MDRAAIFVDAGYLFAQGSVLISGGQKLKRGETLLDEAKALEFLRTLSAKVTTLPLLRLYWYDGTNSGPTAVHVSLAFRADVKVRLGIVNAFGEQKGVDSLIVSDLIDLSRNRAMADALVVTGDEDIRVGVQKAQEVGVRVHLVGIEMETFLTRVAPAPAPLAAPAPVLVPPGANLIQVAAEQFAAALSQADVARVVTDPVGVPPDIDRQLLRAGSASLGGASLVEQEKRELRKAFIKACKTRP
jgi:hypothetical protein